MTELGRFRKPLLYAAITSLVTAALMGIAAILVPEAFEDGGWRVLATTASIGVYALALLCLVVGRHPLKPAMFLLGGSASTCLLLMVLGDIWGSYEDPFLDDLALIAVNLAVYTCTANLLCAVAYGASRVRALLAATLILGGFVFFLTTSFSLGYEADSGVWRLFGVLLILAVLGALLTLILGWVLRDDDAVAHPTSAAAGSDPAGASLAGASLAGASLAGVSPALWAEIDRRRGAASRESFLADLLKSLDGDSGNP